MGDVPILEGDGLRLVPQLAHDLATLLDILTDPTVARWWGDYDQARVAEEYGDDRDDDKGVFLIEADGATAGFIQFGEETDPCYRHASIDIALKAEFQARGIGPTAVRLLVRYLFEERGHHRITIDPAVANTNAIRAYERVGFRPVGIMRQYERGPAGWHDNLLLDLLATEFSG